MNEQITTYQGARQRYAIRAAYALVREHEAEAERKRQERYDELTRRAGADPATHACPHGTSCDIHG